MIPPDLTSSRDRVIHNGGGAVHGRGLGNCRVLTIVVLVVFVSLCVVFR